MTESKHTSSGIGFFGLLAVLFIGLKLTGHITWSRWWVLAPLWVPAAFWTVFVVIVFAVAIVAAVASKK